MLGLLVHPVERFEQRSHLSLIYDSDDGGTHTGPGMAAIVRLPRLTATPLYLLPIAEAAAVVAVKQCHDTFKERLVECYKY